MSTHTHAGATVSYNAAFGQGAGPIWLDDVTCRGFEDRLIECNHPALGIHNCGHHQDVGVSCPPIGKYTSS